MISNSPLHTMKISKDDFNVTFDIEEYVKIATPEGFKYFVAYFINEKDNCIDSMAIDIDNLPTELPDNFDGFIIPKETKDD